MELFGWYWEDFWIYIAAVEGILIVLLSYTLLRELDRQSLQEKEDLQDAGTCGLFPFSSARWRWLSRLMRGLRLRRR